MKVDSDIAFILHTRAYRETSQLVDLFSRHHGRFRVVARGVRGGKTGTGKARFSLQSFTPLQLDWRGRGELKTLTGAEVITAYSPLQGERLYSGFYLNELLLRLLAEHDPHEQLFDQYQMTVRELVATDSLEKLLRNFEMNLLDEIGYGLVMDMDAETGEPVQEGRWYWFDQQQGFVERMPAQGQRKAPNWFRGETLLALTAGDYGVESALRDAKRLLRLALQPHLGDKPLRSRELFRPVARQH